MAILKLSLEQVRTQKVRTALTVLAIAISVSLVVVMTSAHTSAEHAAHRLLSKFMGNHDVLISNQLDPTASIPQSFSRELAAQRDVIHISTRLVMSSMTLAPGEGRESGVEARLVGLDFPKAQYAGHIALGSGEWFERDAGDVAVIDEPIAVMRQVTVGETIVVPTIDGTRELRVVGITEKPSFLGFESQTIYLPLATLQEISDRPDALSMMMIDLRPEVDAAVFAESIRGTVEAIDPRLSVAASDEKHEKIAQNMEYLKLMSYMAGGVSLVAAMFIVFSTLSMGVAERTRTLGMLRAIGMYRAQVAGLVLFEAVTIGLLGGLAGIPIGIGWMMLLVRQFPAFFEDHQFQLDFTGIIIAIAGALGAAILAAIIPAVAATRVSPLDAMSRQGQKTPARLTWIAAVVGLVLIASDFFCVFALPASQELRYYAHLFVGMPAFMLGMFLIAPAIVIFVERALGGLLAYLCRIDATLVRQQLSGSVWRASGTAAALMVGLTTLIVMHTRATSIMEGWQLPDRFPDVMVFTLQGLQTDEMDKLADIPGITPGAILPVAYASPELGSSIFTIGRIWDRKEATIYFGLDPDLVFGDGPAGQMTEFSFIEGSPEEAREMLKKGRHLIVSEEYKNLKNLGVGDTLLLKTIDGRPAPYTIAGVVQAPGIDVIMRLFSMQREFDRFTVSSVMGTIEDAQRDFGVKNIHLLGVNLEPGADVKRVEGDIGKAIGSFTVRTIDARAIKANMLEQFRNIVALLSTIALAAMLVASLGVTNTVIASVRTRRWQFGVLRGIGITRAQLLRMVLVEALLIGCVAAVLGVTAGLLLSVIAGGISSLLIGFDPALVIPWSAIVFGVCLTILVALLASLWPALQTARSDTLALLQSGRASG